MLMLLIVLLASVPRSRARFLAQVESTMPTVEPSQEPSATGLGSPSAAPSAAPSEALSASPTVATLPPSGMPTEAESSAPTLAPTRAEPSASPTTMPSASEAPTWMPSEAGSHTPTSVPSAAASVLPTWMPSQLPSSSAPSNVASEAPTWMPSLAPSDAPTRPGEIEVERVVIEGSAEVAFQTGDSRRRRLRFQHFAAGLHRRLDVLDELREALDNATCTVADLSASLCDITSDLSVLGPSSVLPGFTDHAYDYGISVDLTEENLDSGLAERGGTATDIAETLRTSIEAAYDPSSAAPGEDPTLTLVQALQQYIIAQVEATNQSFAGFASAAEVNDTLATMEISGVTVTDSVVQVTITPSPTNAPTGAPFVIETDDSSRNNETQLILVIIIPIAFLVLALVVIYFYVKARRRQEINERAEDLVKVYSREVREREAAETQQEVEHPSAARARRKPISDSPRNKPKKWQTVQMHDLFSADVARLMKSADADDVPWGNVPVEPFIGQESHSPNAMYRHSHQYEERPTAGGDQERPSYLVPTEIVTTRDTAPAAGQGLGTDEDEGEL